MDSYDSCVATQHGLNEVQEQWHNSPRSLLNADLSRKASAYQNSENSQNTRKIKVLFCKAQPHLRA